MNKNFTVVKEELSESCFKFTAIDGKGDKIFGAGACVFRYMNAVDFKWSKWQINYGSSGAGNYSEKLPYVTVINEAMAFLKEQEAKEDEV